MPAPSRPHRQPNRRAFKALRRQSDAAIAIGGVGVTLVTLSLNHLAHLSRTSAFERFDNREWKLGTHRHAPKGKRAG
jgi:hypothetical protein